MELVHRTLVPGASAGVEANTVNLLLMLIVGLLLDQRGFYTLRSTIYFARFSNASRSADGSSASRQVSARSICPSASTIAFLVQLLERTFSTRRAMFS